MKESVAVNGEFAQAGVDIGHLMGEFSDVRAAPMRVVGALLALLGAALLVVGCAFGIFMIVVGTAFFGLGNWRNKNRVLVYTGGVAHYKRGRIEQHLWRDIIAIALDQAETHHRIGLLPFLTFDIAFCLQLRGGLWIKVKIPPISRLAMKAIQESWEKHSFATTVFQAHDTITL